MGRLFTLFVFGTFFLLQLPRMYACDLSHFELLSSTVQNGNYVLTTRLCMGGGEALPCGLCPLNPCNSCAPGADGDTRDFAISFHSFAGTPINVVAFSPQVISGDSSGCSNTGFNVGPMGPPINSQATVHFVWNQAACFTGPGTPTGIMCSTPSSGCGYAHQQCFDFTFTMDEFPWQIRAWGIEGDGIPTAGCYPTHPDMEIAGVVLPLLWNQFRAESMDSGIEIGWTTFVENGTEGFRIEVMEEERWVLQEEVQAKGKMDEPTHYKVLLPEIQEGWYQFRIVAADLNGSTQSSPILEVFHSGLQEAARLLVYPDPADALISFFVNPTAEGTASVQVSGRDGKVAIQEEITLEEDGNLGMLDIRDLVPGLYFLQVRSGQEVLVIKFVKAPSH